MPRTTRMDYAREEAWDELRTLADWGGVGAPGHEEGRRIVNAARRVDRDRAACALDVIDPTGNSFPVALTAAWDARKANA